MNHNALDENRRTKSEDNDRTGQDRRLKISAKKTAQLLKLIPEKRSP